MTTRKFLMVATLFAVIVATLAGSAGASSHREAPLISRDPSADNTDLYAFVSPDAPTTVTIIANYIPLEEPAGGPNFNSFDDSVLYEIHVDNDGDAEPDITYQFRFKTTIGNPNTFLYNTGPITSLSDPAWNMSQTYTVTRVEQGDDNDDDDDDDDIVTVLDSNIPTPPVNIGPRSTSGYAALMAAAVKTLPGGIKVFAGQVDDPFFVDLGSVFDLAGLRPFNPAHVLPPALPADPGVDGVGGYNTHAIAIQVPISQLAGPDGQMIIGVYASASRQTLRVLRGDGRMVNRGEFKQVSRLGNPLVNEVLIPLGKKDLWNAKRPEDDAQFLMHYTNPELAGLVNLLYPGLPDVATSGRADIVAILLTGVDIPGFANLNFTGTTLADLLRLNMAIPPFGVTGSPCPATPDPMGVLAGDLCGFPNGRRLADDVTDIELRVVAQGPGAIVAGLVGLPDLFPNKLLGDGVNANDKGFGGSFPYLAEPHQGYAHGHHAVGSTTTPPIP